jgi:hypothetical protein
MVNMNASSSSCLPRTKTHPHPASLLLQDTYSSADESGPLPTFSKNSPTTSGIQAARHSSSSPKPFSFFSLHPPSRTSSPDQLRQSRADAGLTQQFDQALEHYFQLMRNIDVSSTPATSPAWETCYGAFLQAQQLREGLKRIGKLSTTTTDDAQYSKCHTMWQDYARKFLAPRTSACSPLKPADANSPGKAEGHSTTGKAAVQREFSTPKLMMRAATTHSDVETASTQCSPYDRKKAVKHAVKRCFYF